MGEKRSKGRGGNGIVINERGNGRWQYRAWDAEAEAYRTKTFARDHDDTNRRKSGTAAGDRWASGETAKFRLGIDSADRLDLASLADQYLAHRTMQGRSTSQLGIIRHATRVAAEAGITALDDRRIPGRLTTHLAQLQACRPGQKRPTPASPRTKNKTIIVLRAMGTFAVKRRLMPFNAFAAVDLFPETRRHRPHYSLDELRLMVAAQHRADPWWPFAVLAVYTGARSETIRALSWGMIDRKANRLRIPAEIQKSSNDTRVPLQPELIAILDEWPSGVGKAPILPAALAALTSDQANQQMQRYLRRLGIDPAGRSVHAVRHSVAGLLVATGLSPFLVMDALGHSSTQTSKHYAALADEYRDEVKALGWREGVFALRGSTIAGESRRDG